MPIATTTTGILGSAWLDMWSLALAIYAALKVFTWWEARPSRAAAWRSAAYLLAWPGMDARAFLYGQAITPPTAREWMLAVVKTVLGLMVVLATTAATWTSSFWQAWTGMIGIVLSLHFGIFHLLSCLGRSVGINAVPLMNWPILSTSVSEFWSRRWNLAFRDLLHRYLFRPLAPRFGAANALWIGFLLSGILHDVVISLPARGDYGLPTLFFVIQAAAISIERSVIGKSFGLGRGMIGWLFTVAVLVLPAPLLFHQAFRENVVLPFLMAIADVCTSG